MMIPNKQKTVVVGMSGGVDSSVAALLLKQQGYHVIGMFMKNWEETDEHGTCKASYEYEDVVRVCEQIGIPYYAVNFVKEYKENVFNQFLEEFRQGHTPNPDILCNREIKFKTMFEKALTLGADYLATGHYCQSFSHDEESILAKGIDPGKDQSYFLYTIKSHVLSKILFPVGNLHKPEVRKIAREHCLATSAKKDSTGICFIGERNFKQFLSQYIAYRPGNFETLEGQVIGTHDGVAYYTIGQRRGMGIGGQGEPWFVVGKDLERNVVYIERGAHHPALFCDELIACEASWVSPHGRPTLPLACRAKVRYRQTDQACTIMTETDKQLKVVFDVPQRAVTPRQSIVFYEGNKCLGGAIIQSAGISYYHQNKALPKHVSL
ncbi:tRNA-specific 2-thiouridylase MnmA [Neochlamydia sp. AcF65]|nr:tRNA-specific 2-thiouridylase MnmA [Neochlamydia sp. AcF65]